VELRERLDARVAGTDEDERELAGAVARRVRRGRGFEPLQDVVAKLDRVLERLEAECVLCQPGDREGAGDGAACDHEPVVADGDQLLLCFDPNGLARRVERPRAADEEFGARAHQSQRDDDVARLERTRRGLGQERREQHEVLAVDDRRLEAALAEEPRHPGAGESAAEDERAAFGAPLGHGRLLPLPRQRSRQYRDGCAAIVTVLPHPLVPFVRLCAVRSPRVAGGSLFPTLGGESGVRRRCLSLPASAFGEHAA